LILLLLLPLLLLLLATTTDTATATAATCYYYYLAEVLIVAAGNKIGFPNFPYPKFIKEITFIQCTLATLSCESHNFTQLLTTASFRNTSSSDWPPLWSSGQSSWLQNGNVLCFLWGTWIYICYVEGRIFAKYN
jgi:hypothetical protein